MTDLTQMIRWNANFVRGLAESVLNRAKVIRTSLQPAVEAAAVTPKVAKVKAKAAVKKAAPGKKSAGKKTAVQRSAKRASTRGSRA